MLYVQKDLFHIHAKIISLLQGADLDIERLALKRIFRTNNKDKHQDGVQGIDK